MKKKLLGLILCLSLIAVSLSGCGVYDYVTTVASTSDEESSSVSEQTNSSQADSVQESESQSPAVKEEEILYSVTVSDISSAVKNFFKLHLGCCISYAMENCATQPVNISTMLEHNKVMDVPVLFSVPLETRIGVASDYDDDLFQLYIDNMQIKSGVMENGKYKSNVEYFCNVDIVEINIDNSYEYHAGVARKIEAIVTLHYYIDGEEVRLYYDNAYVRLKNYTGDPNIWVIESASIINSQADYQVFSDSIYNNYLQSASNSASSSNSKVSSRVIDDNIAAIAKGHWNGLNWWVTSEGELIVTGHMNEDALFVGWSVADHIVAPWGEYTDKVTSAYLAFSGVESLSLFFLNFTNLKEVDLKDLDTSSITDTVSMFFGCSSLTSLDLSSFDTSNITDMRSMFFGCSSLTSLDLSSFDTSNITDMRYMFCGCSSLTSLDLSSFDTSKVTTMGDMFNGCSSLTSLDLSSFDTRNVTVMNQMFKDCSNLKEILVGSDWKQAEYCEGMFDNCPITNVTYK